ncbi:GMC family oxidoreductase [Bacteriovoracaceae bacterium]|nr:GMC family oxidoreductase [Bacteriovoracaceae bacterium]
MKKHFDTIIIGAGVSGPIIAQELSSQGQSVLILEAGKFHIAENFPRYEIDATSSLYWGGGMEPNHDASLAMIRPKVVGGGSIINGGLLDEFDDLAFDWFKQKSGLSFFNSKDFSPLYKKVQDNITINKIPSKFANKNAHIFKQGLKNKSLGFSNLSRGQTNCEYEKGNSCIECLSGCPINSKQSTMTTYLRQALKQGVKIFTEFNVNKIIPGDIHLVCGQNKLGEKINFSCEKLVFAGGSIGNTKILYRSGLKDFLPALGENFYSHPQYMVLGIFNELINSYEGPLQTYKSDDQFFRHEGFKLENVFAPPVAISLLLPKIGKELMDKMSQITHMACIEVAIRDTTPGKISVNNNGKIKIRKNLNAEDQYRKKKGHNLIQEIFQEAGAKEIIQGEIGIGLHLMGGLGIGINESTSVVNEDFQIHGLKNIFVGDSSLFPTAPGINPSLTVMALAHKCAEAVIRS